MLSLLLIIAVTFTSTYYITEKLGIFGTVPRSDLEILYSRVFLAASIIILLIMVTWAVKNVKARKTAGWLKVMSVLLLAGGLWLSYLTRFSVVAVLTEGQTFYSGHREYEPESYYTGRFAVVPDLGIKLAKLEPKFSDDGKAIQSLEGEIQFYTESATAQTQHSIGDTMPKLIHGTWVSVRDFGYSLRYVLKSKEGRTLDSSFIYMRLFPPGSEDSFRLLSPLTYYVRYYPDGKDEGTDPLIRLRIVRNKDIVFNDDVKLSEDVSFENSRIAIEEVRMWTKLNLSKDHGAELVIIGLFFGIASIVIDCLLGIRKYKTNLQTVKDHNSR